MGRDVLSQEGEAAPEWSYLFDADEVGKDSPVRMEIAPDDAAIKGLLKRLNVLSLAGLKADLTLSRQAGQRIVYVQGRITADVQQACVVTLEPVAAHIDEGFEAWFADPDQAVPLVKAKHDRLAKSGMTEVPILDEKDDPEPIVDGKIDLGDLVTQHLSLALNPYPHKDGVHYEYGDDTPDKVPEGFRENPFAALKDWKAKLDD
ncbi:MAG: YceD family protein [Bdellovibrionales bacterium]